MSAISLITKQPLLPVVTITKNDATTYTYNHFTSSFDFRVRELTCTPPYDNSGGKFSITFTSGNGSNSSTNTILNNINEGNEINIWIGKSDSTKTKIFNGVIERTVISEPNKNYMDVTISGPDWGSDLLKSKILNRSWIQKSPNGTLDDTDGAVLISQIVNDMLTDQNSYPTAEYAADDHGLIYTAANVDITSVDFRLPQFEANMEKLNDKLKEIDNIINTTHYIDPDKNFIMRDPTATAADSGVILTDDYSETIGTSGNVGLIAPNSSYIRTLENHYRRIFGVGSQQKTLDQSQQTDDTSTTIDALWQAVRFTPRWISCMQIGIKVSKLGSPTSNLTMQLIEDYGGEPVGEIIRQLSIPPAAITSTAEWEYFDINDELATSKNYWIVLPSVGDASNTYRWHRATGGSAITGGTSATGVLGSWTAGTANQRFCFEEYTFTPIVAKASDFVSASSKHFHEEVFQKPDIKDLQTMQHVLRTEFQNLNKKKEIFKGRVYAPDTVLQTGENVRIRKQQSGYVIDAQFVLGEIEYMFQSGEEEGTGTFYYNIEASRYTSY